MQAINMWVWNGCRYGLRCDMPPNAPLSTYPAYFGPFLGGGAQAEQQQQPPPPQQQQQQQQRQQHKKKKKASQSTQMRTDL
jgi:hypothetical protein